jgi:hypothetical protein
MLEPRADPFIGRKDLQYVGGTAEFDIYFKTYGTTKDDGTPVESDDYRVHIQKHCVRLAVVGRGQHNYTDWDDFALPLRERTNRITTDGLIVGRWGDVRLTEDDVDVVTTYIQTFVPWLWVLGCELTGVDADV